jgi:hypothetical protein
MHPDGADVVGRVPLHGAAAELSAWPCLPGRSRAEPESDMEEYEQVQACLHVDRS